MADDPRNVTGIIQGPSAMTDKVGPFAQVRDPHLLGGQRDAQGNYITRPVRKENRKRQGIPGGGTADGTDFDIF